MVTKIFFVIATILLVTTIHAQENKELDSLVSVLNTLPDGEQKLDVYGHINKQLMRINAKKDLMYLVPAEQLARKLNDKEKADFFLRDIGVCYSYIGNYEKALGIYLDAAKRMEDRKDYKALASVYYNIGFAYIQMNNLEKAKNYTQQAEVLILQYTNDLGTLADLYQQKSQLYDMSGDHDSSVYFMRKVLAIDKQIVAQHKSGPITIVGDYVQLGLSTKHAHNTAKALLYFDTAKAILDTLANKDKFANTIVGFYNNLGATLVQAGKYAQARKAFDTSIVIGKRIGNLLQTMENYRNLADMYGETKEYKNQNIYLKQYYELKDSIFNTDKKVKMTELEANYRLGQKDASLALQEKQTAVEKSQKQTFLTTSIAAIIVLLLVILFYVRTRKNNYLLANKNILIEQQRDELQSLNAVKDRLFSVISHDLRNPINTIKTYLNLTGNKKLSLEKQAIYQQQISQSVTHTSNLLDNLLVWANLQLNSMPPTITQVSISDCVADVIAAVQLQASYKQVSITKKLLVETASTNANILEIILRNLLTNAIKYSVAGANIELVAFKQQQTICIAVKDYGHGISDLQLQAILANKVESTGGTENEKGSGIGLLLVRQLVLEIKGRLVIDSKLGSGSTFTVELPA